MKKNNDKRTSFAGRRFEAAALNAGRRYPGVAKICAALLFLFAAGSPAASLIRVSPSTVIQPTENTPENQGPNSSNRVLPGERPTRKSYIIPALEIPAFIITLNRYDQLAYGPGEYGVSYGSIRDHIYKGPWVVDQDSFEMNQVGHPYSGSIYYGFARSAGLSYWESLLYSNAGSLIWELAGETTDPSINDQVATGVAGSFAGEELFRLSNLLLEEGGKHPAAWRRIAAGLISPPTALNRYIFGDRYGPVLESRQPALYSRLQLGVVNNADITVPGSVSILSRTPSYGNFTLNYGFPGKPAYLYNRPFDYFDFEVDSINENIGEFTSVMMRGLLFGVPYEAGDNYRGVWGLYGTFDNLSPQVYRLSTTAGSFGTTGQWWLSKRVALQGTALAGLGFGAAGTIVPDSSEADFHYGVTPQELLSLRLIMGRRVMIDVSGRNYYITGAGAANAPGVERIQYVSSSLAVRIYGHHAVSIGYLLSNRSARYSVDLPDRNQFVRTVTFTYNLLGQPNFGAVEWRDDAPDDL